MKSAMTIDLTTAKFGDKFKTRDGSTAVYKIRHKTTAKSWHEVLVELTPGEIDIRIYHDNGKVATCDPCWDIVEKVN